MTDNAQVRTVTTHVVGEGDDAITYDVHGDLSEATAERPALFVLGAPMDASGFVQLVERITDRPVVTYDPRGAGRNPTGTDDISAQQHGADVHRVIEALDAGPVDVFGSSGGAVSVLAMLAEHGEAVRRAVVHEPPLAEGLPDADTILAVIDDMKRTYDRDGGPAAMAKFISLVMHDGPLGADYLAQPAPDPAMFGMPAADDGSRTDPLFRNMPGLIDYRVDVEALRGLGDRLIVAAGVESGNTMAARGARSVAERTGRPVTEFPSHHGGFASSPGMPGDPDGFAERLRDLLAAE